MSHASKLCSACYADKACAVYYFVSLNVVFRGFVMVTGYVLCHEVGWTQKAVDKIWSMLGFGVSLAEAWVHDAAVPSVLARSVVTCW